jgi:hypothetical protein
MCCNRSRVQVRSTQQETVTLDDVFLHLAIPFIGLGMIMGMPFSLKTVPFAYVVLILTSFGGAWMDLSALAGLSSASPAICHSLTP